jgi:glycosyltransferase involved in cell wall biosynthesis
VTQLNLRCVTFPRPRAAIRHQPLLRAEADVYVQTPAIDNMPLSVLEAFASGLPVVSTGVGGVPAILTHGVHGLLAPANDDEAVAAHVVTLLESPDYARQLAAAARETCAGYTWPVAREGWLAAYRSVANRPSSPAPARSK